jgi:hypothetical protein
MRKWIALLALIALLLVGCTKVKYTEADFLGKTSAYIVAEFGEFDCIGNHPDADGMFRNTSCGYTIQEPRVGFLGTDPEVLFFISFDENGIAVRCYEGYRPGG